MDRVKHMRAMEKLRRLKPNDLVEVAVEDNYVSDVATLEDVKSQDCAVLRTTGYYQCHTKDYIYLSTDYLENEDDRSAFNVYLVRYLVDVVPLRRVRRK